jgi:integrase
MALEDVVRKNIVLRVDEIADEHGKVAADRARTALSAFFSWTIEKGYIDSANPASDIKRRATNGSRARVLTEAELAEIWSAAGEGDYAAIVRLAILTGQRKTELGDLTWAEIDREKAQITLPVERVKNRREHIIPVSAEALQIIESVPPRLGRDLLFGDGDRGFSGWSSAKKALDKRINAARVKADNPDYNWSAFAKRAIAELPPNQRAEVYRSNDATFQRALWAAVKQSTGGKCRLEA